MQAASNAAFVHACSNLLHKLVAMLSKALHEHGKCSWDLQNEAIGNLSCDVMKTYHDTGRSVFWLQPFLSGFDQPPDLFTGHHDLPKSSVNCCLTRVS